MNLFSTLSMTTSALGVNQTAISVLSNNIANMNTDGYSKQKVNLAAVTVGGNIATADQQANTNAGVEITSITRYNNQFLASYYRGQITSESNLSETATQTSNIATLFDDISGQGLSSSIESFYSSLDNLNQYPSDYSARSNFVTNASSLAQSINTVATKLNALKTKSVGDGTTKESLDGSEIATNVNKVNTCLSTIANINQQIASSSNGTLENNNLLDQRDVALKELATYGNFGTDISSDGTVNVTFDSNNVIQGSQVKTTFGVQTASDYKQYCTDKGLTNTNTSNAVITMTTSDGKVIQNANSKFTSGTIDAILTSNDSSSTQSVTVDNIMSKLDTLASSVSTIFNDIQTRSGAYYIDNSTGKLSNANLSDYKLFVPSDGSDKITASNISINSKLTGENGAYKIATAYFDSATPVDLNSTGSSTNVVAMKNTSNNATPATSTFTYDSFGANITYTTDTNAVDIATATGAAYDPAKTYYKGSNGTYIIGAPGTSGSTNIYSGGVGTSVDSTKFISSGDAFSSINNLSFEDYYKGIVSDISTGATNAATASTTQSDLVSSISSKLNNETKVDLNEELTDLIKFQTAYSASARVFSTCSDILQTLTSLGQ